MNQKYFERKIDELGRVTIPDEVRKELGLQARSTLAITVMDGEIALTPACEKYCAICNDSNESTLRNFEDKHLCDSCIIAIDNNELVSTHCCNNKSAIRKIDELGRFVLPITERKRLGLEPGNKVIIYIDNKEIFVKPAANVCFLCSDDTGAVQSGNINFCTKCMEKISDMAKKCSNPIG